MGGHGRDRRGRGRGSGRPPRARAAAALAALAALASALTGAAAHPPLDPEDAALLARTNLFSTVPERFHARLAVSRGGAGGELGVEVWRGGRDRLLARVLDGGRRARFVLQLGADHYLIAPGARAPVRLSPAVAAAGAASLEQLLGVDVERDFAVERVEAAGRIVTFHLAARPGAATARTVPRARWVVDRDAREPLRADLMLADGRVARVVEFAAFTGRRPRLPSRLVVKDVLRGGPPVIVEVRALAESPVPDALFSLTDGSARAALPPAE